MISFSKNKEWTETFAPRMVPKFLPSSRKPFLPKDGPLPMFSLDTEGESYEKDSKTDVDLP